ncbi:NAD-dependent epimerase/dehydratase family protein [Paenibacillus sepulcri]|uniref:NAD-dependent epimerase/dehydratase family protein n=1 Tax=Paenibacillus sepulcri TaxID=359917 RepID=A0ABS7CGM8_9BACL|nr:NAD-dependent epimerase/dehydratase family protein [Paenibacillus sepulcri]
MTGATGFVGGEVLKQALEDSSITGIMTLTRRPLGVTHPKLEDVILQDFLDYSRIKASLKADACIWCLGVSQTAVSREEYIKITFDYAVMAARAMFSENPHMRFCFLSGSRADQEEKSRVLYGRIKGRTERELGGLSPNVYHFRPAFIRHTSRTFTAHPISRRISIC